MKFLTKYLIGISVIICCRGLLSAKSINNYIDKTNFPVIIPRAQKLERQNGNLVLPDNFSIYARTNTANEEKILSVGILQRFPNLKITHTADKKTALIILELNKNIKRNYHDFYCIDISEKTITIQSPTIQGLYYGVQTILNMVNNVSSAQLPQCHIEDWADLQYRSIFLDLRFANDEKIIDLAKRTIPMLGSLKYNILQPMFGTRLPLHNDPFTARKTKPYSQKAIDEFTLAAKQHHIQIIPRMQAITHVSWLEDHPDFNTKITARPVAPGKKNWKCFACPAKPLGRQLTEYMIKELIRIFNPKIVNISLDEFHLCQWQRCMFCNNGHSAEQIVSEIKHMIEFTKAQGVIPMVYFDSFVPNRQDYIPGSLEALGSDTVVGVWDYAEKPNLSQITFYKKRNMATLGGCFSHLLTNTMVMPQECVKYGATGSTLSLWQYAGGCLYAPSYMSAHGAASIGIFANYAWNSKDVPFCQLDWDPAYEVRRRLEHPQEIRPDTLMQPVNLSHVFNAKIGTTPDFPLLDANAVKDIKTELAKAPKKFHLAVTQQGNIAAILLSGGKDGYEKKSKPISINGKINTACVLLTATRPDDPNQFLYSKARRLPALLTIRFNYDNKKFKLVKLRYQQDFNNWNHESSGFHSRFVIRGNDLRNALFSFFACNVKNPAPELTVKSISFSSDAKYGIAPAILAVSTIADVNIPIKDIETNTALLEKLSAPKSKSFVKITEKNYFADFDKTLGKVKVSFEGNFSQKPTWKIVNDPSAITPGKVIKITLPPSDSPCARVMLDFPIKVNGKLTTLLADYKIDKPECATRSGYYMINKLSTAMHIYYNFHSTSNKWNRLEIPLAACVTEGTEPGGVDETTAARLRLSFWVKNPHETVNIYFDNIGTSPEVSNWQKPYLTTPVMPNQK